MTIRGCMSVILFLAMVPAWSLGERMEAPVEPVRRVVISAEDLVEGVAARAERLTQGRFTFTAKAFAVDNPEVLLLHRDFAVTKSGPKELVVRTETRAQGTPSFVMTRWTWDGRQFRAVTEWPNQDVDRRFEGVIDSTTGLGLKMGYWRLVTQEELPLSQVPIAQVLRDGAWEVIGSRRIGAYQAWGLRNVKALAEFPHTSYEIWIVPDHDFAAVEIREVMHRPPLEAIRAEVGAVHLVVQDGIWCGDQMQVHISNRNITASDQVFCFEGIRFTADIPDDPDLFALRFPVGTAVVDEITKTSFIAGKLVSVPDANGVHRFVPISEYPEYSRLTDPSRGLSEEEWRRTRWAQIPLSPTSIADLVDVTSASITRPTTRSVAVAAVPRSQPGPGSAPSGGQPWSYPAVIYCAALVVLLAGVGIGCTYLKRGRSYASRGQ